MTGADDVRDRVMDRLSETVEMLNRTVADLRVAVVEMQRDISKEIYEAIDDHWAHCQKKKTSVPPDAVTLRIPKEMWKNVLLIVAAAGIGGSGIVATAKQILSIIGQ